MHAIKLHVMCHLSFNVSKCRCMVIGKMFNAVISPLYISNLQMKNGVTVLNILVFM